MFSEGLVLFLEGNKFSLICFPLVSAVVKNHWLEGNTEPQIENITFDQNQVDFSTVVSKEGVMVQTPRKIHPSLDAPENITLQTETAAARGINDSSGRTEFTVPHYGPGRTTTLTSQSSTLGEFMLMTLFRAWISSPGKPNIWWSLPSPILSHDAQPRVLGQRGPHCSLGSTCGSLWLIEL